MTSFLPSTFRNGKYGPETKLQHVIVDRAAGFYNNATDGVSSTLHSLSETVESAFVLIPREALPKVSRTSVTATGGSFVTGEGQSIQINDGANSAAVRKVAATWLAVAALLEAEEKGKADEAKRKADEDKAALEAEALRDRLNRLEELATEYFDEPFDYLGTKKKAAIEEIYRLELELNADDVCDECAA